MCNDWIRDEGRIGRNCDAGPSVSKSLATSAPTQRAGSDDFGIAPRGWLGLVAQSSSQATRISWVSGEIGCPNRPRQRPRESGLGFEKVTVDNATD